MRDGNYDSAARALSVNASVDPEDAKALVNAGYAFYEAQVARALDAVGIDSESRHALYQWAQQNAGEKLTQAVQQLVTTRRHDGWRALAVEYKKAQHRTSGATAEQRWRSFGLETHFDPTTGDLLVRKDGGRFVPAYLVLRNARKQG